MQSCQKDFKCQENKQKAKGMGVLRPHPPLPPRIAENGSKGRTPLEICDPLPWNSYF